MIVDPDFPDHWKVEFLTRAAGESSVRCLLRFWAHCQQRKQWKFTDMTPLKLASICKYVGDENTFYKAMSETFLDCGDNGDACAHEWNVVNKRLLHNWKAGKKGGRPRVIERKPKGSVQETLVSNLILSSLSSGTRARFEKWMEVRKAQGKKPKNWDSMFQEQADWLSTFPEPVQLEILGSSIRHNYQGLFEPRQGKNGSKPEAQPNEWTDENGQKWYQDKHGQKFKTT